jgi:hypothetical protein
MGEIWRGGIHVGGLPATSAMEIMITRSTPDTATRGRGCGWGEHGQRVTQEVGGVGLGRGGGWVRGWVGRAG